MATEHPARNLIAGALFGSNACTSKQRAHFGADQALSALEDAGYRVLHPKQMAANCEDPWVCCIHTAPEDVAAWVAGEGA